jgi:hypothetical protein
MQSAFESEKVLPVINYAVDIECKSINVLVKLVQNEAQFLVLLSKKCNNLAIQSNLS